MCNQRNHAHCDPKECDLFRDARERAAAMTPEDWQRQRISFVYGTLHLEPDLPRASRARIAKVARKLPPSSAAAE